ncbi:MAG: hypothetical protein ACREQN_04485 [Candidatus Binataceae bacterium]
MIILNAPFANAAAGHEDDAAAALERMARASFGALGPAELRLVRNAPLRTLAWSGPSSDPAASVNDPEKAATWGPDRTVRAAIIRWLLTDPAAAPYVHPSGVGVAGAKITGHLDLSFLSTNLPLTLLDCALPDGFDFSSANLNGLDLAGSSAGPIVGDRAIVKNDVMLTFGKFHGVSLFRTHIGGDLDCSGGHFSGAGGTALSAVETTIRGDANFLHGFESSGVVDFRLAEIGRSLSFNHARFTGGGQNGLNAERATIAGTIYWVGVTHTRATLLDLENAHAAALWDDAASWPAPGNLILAGFAYGDFSGGPMDAADRLDWIGRQPVSALANPQPYRELAQVLRDSGDEEGATRVMIAKENAVAEHGGLGLADRVWKCLLWMTIGYGYRPLRALWWVLGFVLTGAALFRWGYGARLITPTEQDAYARFVETGTPPPHYPPFSSLVYSLENFLPVVDLHQGSYWRPNPHHVAARKRRVPSRQAEPGTIPARLLRWYLWLHILAGWTITPLLFAGLAGLLRE